MSKPHDPKRDKYVKAPTATRPAAPFHEASKKASSGSTDSRAAIPRKTAGRKPPSADLSSRVPPPPSAEPGARISRRAADRLRAGHVWVYASDIESLEVDDAAPPSLLPVADNRGLLLGTALYSPSSQIALRLVARNAIDENQWLSLLAHRLRIAIARSTSLLDENTDACRLVFSEADELPGLVIDKYGELAILQLLTKGLDTAAVREVCVRVLREELVSAPKPDTQSDESPDARRLGTILERPDPRIRELEGLAVPLATPLWVRDEAAPTRTNFHLNGLEFVYDANAGQKTGAFLDQRLNYAAAADWARRLGKTGRALDVCCYQGGFSLHLGRFCGQVTGIDASRASLEVAEQNLAANRAQIRAAVDWVEGDAFQILREWSVGGERFDTIVLDPPAFAKSRKAVEGALRGYKELNLRAIKMASAGGLLVTCSCSHHVGWTDLEGAVAQAAADAGRRVRLLERRGAAPDHPVVLNLPETEYLKCLVLEVE